MPFLHLVFDIEAERRLFTGSEEVVNDPQPVYGIKLCTYRAQAVQLRCEVSADTGEIRPGVFHALFADRHSEILILHDGIGSSRFIKKHIIILLAVDIQVVILKLQEDLLLKITSVQSPVVYRYLSSSSAVQRVKEL